MVYVSAANSHTLSGMRVIPSLISHLINNIPICLLRSNNYSGFILPFVESFYFGRRNFSVDTVAPLGLPAENIH